MRKKLKTIKFFTGVFCIIVLCSVWYSGTTTNGTKQMSHLVVIDAGHGLPDGGATGKSGVPESEINLKVSKIVEKELNKAGVDTLMTREGEQGLCDDNDNSVRSKKREDLKNRVKIINESGARLAVSIHMNYFGDSQYSGPQLFIKKESNESRKAALCIKNSIISDIGEHCTREIKETTDNIYIIRNSEIPIVLAECGFLSNREEEKLLITDEYCEKMGKAIAKGIISYLSDNT